MYEILCYNVPSFVLYSTEGAYASSGTAEGSSGQMPQDLNPDLIVASLAAELQAWLKRVMKLQFFGMDPVVLMKESIEEFQVLFRALKKDLQGNIPSIY